MQFGSGVGLVSQKITKQHGTLRHGNNSINIGGLSVISRKANGDVVVISLARTWAPRLTREANGNVIIS